MSTNVRSRFYVAAMDCGAEEQLVRLRLGELTDIFQVEVDLRARTVDVVHRADPVVVDQALSALRLGSEHLDTEQLDEDSEAVPTGPDPDRTRQQRRALRAVLAINATMFLLEVTAGLVSGSLGVLADGLDMGADAAVYALSLLAVGAAAATRARITRLIGWSQLALAVLGLAEVIRRVATDAPPPDVLLMVTVTVLALLANVVSLLVLRSTRDDASNMRASWICTSNDVQVNALVLAAAGAVAWFDLAAPDLLVGGVVFAILANGARRILLLTHRGTTRGQR